MKAHSSPKESKQRTRDALSTFVPETMKWILSSDKAMKVPDCTSFPSVALFADVSGFTNLTEKLSGLQGTLGVEILADEINNYLTQIIKIIVGAGGDVFKFAGDALLCLWPPEFATMHGDEDANDFTSLVAKQNETVLRVIRCALDIQTTKGEMSKCGVKELALRIKLGIGMGNVDVLVVGGIFNRFENLPAGEAFFEAFNCENDSPKFKDGVDGPVIISNKCYHMVKKHIEEATPIGDLGNYLVRSISNKIRRKRNNNRNNLNFAKDDALFKRFAGYIPSAVVPHLRMPEQAWVGELRQVTIMFLSLPFNANDIRSIQSSTQVLRSIHSAIQLLQTIIYRYQGSLNKFLVDDKGSTVMAVFGLPPVAHRNDPERAVMAALDLRNEFTMKGVGLKSDGTKHQVAIGITAGIVYLGLVGGAGSRREYSVLGDKVNLAARLMGLCKKKSATYGEIAVDESIRTKVNLDLYLDWQPKGETKVKGKSQNIKVYIPITKERKVECAKLPKAWMNHDSSDKHYITECSKMIQILHEQGIGRAIFVEGEAGLGKAALILRVREQTKSRIWWLWGKGDWVDETREDIKFPVWKQILLDFANKLPFYEEKYRRSFEKYIERRRPDLREWLFLLSYFDLISFVREKEYSADAGDADADVGTGAKTVNTAERKKNATNEKLQGTIWERNESLVQDLKAKIQTKIETKTTAELLKFEAELEHIRDLKKRSDKKKRKEQELRKMAQTEFDKKIGNYIYDVVLCLLEWGGSKANNIAIVIHGLQWLRGNDWSLTRRFVFMLNKGLLRHCALFTSSTPMNIKRYTPHYIPRYYVEQYTEMQSLPNSVRIVPKPWGIQKTKMYIKTYFKQKGAGASIHVSDVSPKLVEIVHSQSGGRPGYCKEFLDLLYLNRDTYLQFTEMRAKGEKKMSFSPEFEHHLASKTQYASIPIPPSVQAITTRHLDVLKPELLLCLKTAATICVSKGTRCLSFLKSSLRGCHPIKQFVEGRKIDETLQQLCQMKFITKLPDLEDISYALNMEGDASHHHYHNQKTQPCQLYTQSSVILDTQHGHSSVNHYAHNVKSHRPHRTPQAQPQAQQGSSHSIDVMSPDITGPISMVNRYGSGTNNVLARNKMSHDSLTDGAAFGVAGAANASGSGRLLYNGGSSAAHLRSFSSVSVQSGGEFEYDDDAGNNKMQHDENRTKFTENMPTTQQLLTKPLHKMPYKKDVLIKRKDGLFAKGQERVFVFKGKTLYWFRNANADQYPLGRIKFDESILRLQKNPKHCEIFIKVSRKDYYVRAKSIEEMEEWHALFATAMNSEPVQISTELDNRHEQKTQMSSQLNGATTLMQTKSAFSEDASVEFDDEKMPPASAAPTMSVNNTSQIVDFGPNKGECYEFTHGFLRDAIYEQMLFMQRIRIHKASQEYLRKVLKSISLLPAYPAKELDTRDYSLLLQRHQNIDAHYKYQMNNIGELISIATDTKKKSKKKNKMPGFVGLE